MSHKVIIFKRHLEIELNWKIFTSKTKYSTQWSLWKFLSSISMSIKFRRMRWFERRWNEKLVCQTVPRENSSSSIVGTARERSQANNWTVSRVRKGAKTFNQMWINLQLTCWRKKEKQRNGEKLKNICLQLSHQSNVKRAQY